jgi:hypothetical protein
MLLAYLRTLTAPRLLLWCYLFWYLYAAVRYFDPSVRLWASSLGMSAVIGTGLYVSTAYSGGSWRRLGFWPVFRFYLMPFCVSSFSALIKGQEFVFIFHPRWEDNVTALSLCGGLCLVATAAKRSRAVLPT